MKYIDHFTNRQLKYIVKKSNSMKDLFDNIDMVHTGDSSKIMKKKLKQKKISIRHFGRGVRKVTKHNNKSFSNKVNVSRQTLIRIILKEKLIPYICDECNLVDSWNNKKLVLVLDHINGKNKDNRIKNLRFLCPNCNSQSKTFAGRNVKWGKTPNFIKIKNKIETKNKTKYVHTFKNNVKKKKLIDLLLKKRSLVKVGKTLKISASTVKKRCVFYNIDFKHYCMLFPYKNRMKKHYKKSGNYKVTAKAFKTGVKNLKNILNNIN